MLSETRDAPVTGIALMMGFLIIAPFIEVFAKLAAPQIPVAQIASARFVVQTACMLPVALFMGVLGSRCPVAMLYCFCCVAHSF